MESQWSKAQRVYCVFKRFLDIVISLVGLIILIPFIIIIGPLIKLQDKGPIFFKQKRTGRYGKEFTLIKFRSMPVDNDVRDFTVENKMTKIGKFIRRTSIDELPQFWNIFKGEMSFVGPRPWIPEYYQNMTKKQRGRYLVRPGITGLAQVNGRNAITVTKKIKYDLEYVKGVSLRMDTKIILLTIMTVFRKSEACSKKTIIKDELKELRNN